MRTMIVVGILVGWEGGSEGWGAFGKWWDGGGEQ